MTPHTKQYALNHHLVSKARGPAKGYACEHCGRPAEDWATVAGLDSEQNALDPWTGFIALCKKCHRAYDKRPGPTHWTGRHHSPESIEKIRQAKLGRSNHTPESRQKISQALGGKKKSPETRERMRRAQSRRPRGVAEIRHGTTSGYRRGCRCDSCRTAQAVYKRTFFEEKGRWP